MTEFRFIGDWRLWYTLPLALLAGVAVWWFYRRETRRRTDHLAWLLPLLRAAAIVLLILTLTEPVLHHRWIVGRLARVLIFVDGSPSMATHDRHMAADRKLRSAVNLGLLSDELLPKDILAALEALDRARQAAGNPDRLDAVTSPPDDNDRARELLGHLEETYNYLRQIPLTDDFPAGPLEKGKILYEYWDNINGSAINDLIRDRRFPLRPNGFRLLDSLEGPANWKDNYGSRISGFLLPPASGDYRFWICSDDASELYLSPSEQPAQKIRIARVTGWTARGQWQQTPEQQSAAVTLQSGRRYYLEILHKEGSGEDHIAVGWQRPDGGLQRPIPGAFLACQPPQAAPSAPRSPADVPEEFRADLLEPARALARAKGLERRQFLDRLAELAQATEQWHQRLRSYFESWAQQLARSNRREVKEAIETFDRTDRWQRVQALLLETDNPLLDRLIENHHVDVAAFTDQTMQWLWRGRAEDLHGSGRIPQRFPERPPGQATNLRLGLDAAIRQLDAGASEKLVRSDDEGSARLAVVILSDGRHNYGDAPLAAAEICGQMEIPVFAVGMGAERPAEDVAVVRVECPDSVFYKDKVKGRIELKDTMTAGRPFVLRITAGQTVLWEESLQTDGSGRRAIDYEFPVEDFLQRQLAAQPRDLTYRSFPLALQAQISGLESVDAEPANDRQDLHVRANFQKNKLLLLSGRPRWEFRYLHNLFVRDETWEVTALVIDPIKPNGGIERGDRPGQFPIDRKTLYTYDLIVLGDFPAAWFQRQELEWLRDCIDRRGSGLIWIDGRREHLRRYEDTPLAELVPITWRPREALENITTLRLTEKGKLRLTEAGSELAALSLTTDEMTDAQVWSNLKPPHWLAAVEALGGTEVLVEAVVEDQTVPALVFRRFGAGKVLFAAFDESWRWRFRVADRYHGKYWNQMAALMMARSFAVRDRFVSLDTGTLMYNPGQTAEIRARIRDAEGKPVFQAVVLAHLYRDGGKVSTIPLLTDGQSGDFRGVTDPLEPGDYEIRISVLGYPADQMQAAAPFYVRPPEAGELTELSCDAALLGRLAETSGGQYFREEDIPELVERLKPLSQGKVVEQETALWKSFWWFGAILLLLGLEWILRKRAGML